MSAPRRALRAGRLNDDECCARSTDVISTFVVSHAKYEACERPLSAFYQYSPATASEVERPGAPPRDRLARSIPSNRSSPTRTDAKTPVELVVDVLIEESTSDVLVDEVDVEVESESDDDMNAATEVISPRVQSR